MMPEKNDILSSGVRRIVREAGATTTFKLAKIVLAIFALGITCGVSWAGFSSISGSLDDIKTKQEKAAEKAEQQFDEVDEQFDELDRKVVAIETKIEYIERIWE